MRRYRLRLTWIRAVYAGSLDRVSFTRSFAGRACAERRAKSFREVALISRVDVVPAPIED
jgi:hypothetical protein